jgi:predicted DNA-binding transcriptional regulator AlpA
VTETGKTTRAQRMAMPLARDVVKDIAISHGGCIRPVQLRRTDLATGQTEQVLVPCGHTLASVCPACAERGKNLRAAQCREGWHLDREPDLEPDPATDNQEWWIEKRAEAQALRDRAAAAGEDTGDLDELLAELDEEVSRAGMRGKAAAATTKRRHRSTRRRQDAPPLPRRKVDPRTVGKTYTAPDGTIFRPSLFLTLTCPSYGRVTGDGTPVDPARYDYAAAARDALHFAALFDRFIQNLRRYCGYDLQYFAAIEPQRRLAPHAHMALRGTIARRELREVIAATYHQVWWPSTKTVRFDGDQLPVWDEAKAVYLDPDTGEVLTAWDQALDAISDTSEPSHVARFGEQFRAEGVLAGSRDANRCIGYLTKYLTKHLGDCHELGTDNQAAHAGRLAEALRWELCSPACANWLRYGIQPKNARKGLRPGACKGKAHRREYLGYAGRRVLTSRKWSGKTLADHRADRKNWLTEMLGLPATDPARYTWEHVQPGDPDHIPRRATAAARRRRPDALAPGTRPSPQTSPGHHRRSFGNREGSMTTGQQEQHRDDPLAGLPLLISVPRAATLLGISRAAAYRFASAGDLPTKRLGRRVYVISGKLREFIALEDEAA